MGEFIPHIVEAEYVRDYIIRVKFNDGVIKVLDLGPYVEKGGVFSKFRDRDLFKQFLSISILSVGRMELILRPSIYTRLG